LVGQSLSPLVLVEEYLDGPEFSLDVILLEGDLVFAAACRKKVGPPPYFIEVGHVYPAGLSMPQYAMLLRTAIAALRAISLGSGVAHMELRLHNDEFKVIEVNLRPPGGRMSEMLLTATGVDLRRVHLQIMSGVLVDPPTQTRALGAVYECITVEAPSRLYFNRNDIHVQDVVARPLVELDINSGDAVLPVGYPGGRIAGRIVAFGESISSTEKTIEEIKVGLRLYAEPIVGEKLSELILAAQVQEEAACGCWTRGCC